MTTIKVREHGTHAKYVVEKCRCDLCRAANSLYERRRSARIEPPYVDAGPVREHVLFLRSQGVGAKQIVKAAGVSHGMLAKLVYGDGSRGMPPTKRVRPSTAEKILAVMPSDAADGATVDAGPAWEIIDGLVAAGVPKLQIAERLGQTGPGLQLRRTRILARHARAVAEMGDQWKAGLFTYERRYKGRPPITVTLPPPDTGDDVAVTVERRNRAHERSHYRALEAGETPDPTPVYDDADRFLVEMAEVFEARTDHASWRVSSACRGRPAWMWHPAPGDTATAARAKRVCAACPVAARCLDAHLDEPAGIYGGLDDTERAALRERNAA